jgi:hypothetical protein
MADPTPAQPAVIATASTAAPHVVEAGHGGGGDHGGYGGGHGGYGGDHGGYGWGGGWWPWGHR